MPYLLDGNNLIGRARPSEEERARLIAELASRLRKTRARAILVFDGTGGRETSLGPLTIREGFGDSADEDIVRQIGRAKNPREMIVVTGDRALAGRVREAGGKILAPDEFWDAFGRSRGEPGTEEAAVDVEEWIRYFDQGRDQKD